jgi:hypothetical protein
MDHVHIVQRHLAGLELEVYRRCFVERAGCHALVQRQVLTVLVQVVVQALLAVRPWDHAEAAIRSGGGLKRDPDGAGCQGADRPVVPVLMPRGLKTCASRFAKDVAAPQDHVVADHF